MATKLNTKVVTNKVRLSYVHLFEPYSNKPDQDAKYSTVILVPKSDTKTIEKIQAAQQAALENAKDTKFKGKIPANWKNTFRDGDDPDEADLEKNPEYAGHYFMTVSNNTRPGVVDRALNAITEPGEIYSGCYARVSLNAFAFNTSGNRGVSFGLNNVQKMADGEVLGGAAARAEDDFDALDDEDLL